MSTLRFDGAGAGLGKRLGGDTNSPHDYTLVCSCGVDLGPLSRFSESAETKLRTARCMKCDLVTLVQGTQVAGLVPFKELAIARAVRGAAR